MEKEIEEDEVIFGEVGGKKWERVNYEVRKEEGILRMRKDMKIYENMRNEI